MAINKPVSATKPYNCVGCIIILGKELYGTLKYEIRISKYETNPKYKNINVQNTGFPARKWVFGRVKTVLVSRKDAHDAQKAAKNDQKSVLLAINTPNCQNKSFGLTVPK